MIAETGRSDDDRKARGANPAVAVVVLNFGVHELLEANLGGLGLDDHGMRLVVVDNYSTAGERDAVEVLADRHDWDLVALPDNRGFAAGINAGLRHAIGLGCRASIILNPDAAVDLGVLAALRDDVLERPMELVSPRIVTAATGREFVGADVLLASGRIRGRHIDPARAEPSRTVLHGSGVRPLPQSAAWLSGACMAVHHQLLERVGYLDEEYFLYWEDIDFSVRSAEAGAALVVRSDLEVRHDEAGTQERPSDRAKSTTYYYYNCRNRLLFASRHLPRSEILRWMAATPAVSWEILLRGGRRQLLATPAPAMAALRGSVAGLAIASAAVARSVVTADPTRAPRSSFPTWPDADTPAAQAGGLAVTIALLTFRRPEAVAAAVTLVLAQIEDAAARFGQRYRFDVLVVDNDPQRSAAGVGPAFDGSVRYLAEPEPGISAGRNRAIDESAGSDLLIFIDDDERPGPGWLRHLLDTRDATGATAVAGAVRSTFEQPLDGWITAGGFFDRRRLRTGTEIGTAATNNLLLDLRQTRRLGVRFDAAFGLSGGGDTMFTRSIRQRGGVLVWCDEAVVDDVVPASRMTRRWVLARAFRSGNSWSRVGVAISPTRRARLASQVRYGALGLPRVAGGVTRFSYGVATGSDRHRARGLRTAARGAGMAAGALGWVHREYTRADDDRAEGAGVGAAA